MTHTLVCIDVYTVAEGDTLYSISDKYDLPVSLLMRVNRIRDPYNLAIGTRLCIPGDPCELPAKPEPPSPSVPPAPPKPTIHTVEAGDTLYLIAKRYSIKLDDLMEQNPDIDPYNLMIGTRLRLPL